MHTTGKMKSFSLFGRSPVMMLEITGDYSEENINKLLQSEKLVIDIKELKDKRSKEANAYFWKLCDMMGKKMRPPLTKQEVHDIELKRWGVFFDQRHMVETVPMFRYLTRENISCEEELNRFKTIEVQVDEDTGEELGNREIEWVTNRWYFGSHTYDTKEMSDLIEGVVMDAKELGVDTMTPEERAKMIAAWEAR